ncbi:MAG: hypothetical protein ACO3NU_11900, partial [Arenicellales bacterium]
MVSYRPVLHGSYKALVLCKLELLPRSLVKNPIAYVLERRHAIFSRVTFEAFKQNPTRTGAKV